MSLIEHPMPQTRRENVLMSEGLVKLSPRLYRALILDMDGVVTRTAWIHALAWKEIFDDFLRHHARRKEAEFLPFDIQSDYRRYVDGMAREDGVRRFLNSRHILLPEGRPDDPPDAETIHGLANRKNERFLQLLQERGVQPYESTVALVQKARQAGMRVAVISASKNAEAVLRAANVLDLFDVKVDGLDAERLHLRGKPEPDVFQEAARQLNVSADQAVVMEDALAGVQAGASGHFGLVIGVNRDNQTDLLKSHGADVVVNDLRQVFIVEPTAALESAEGMSMERADPWQLVYDRYEPDQERVRETLCTLGNGYFATRGAGCDAVDDGTHYPGTYLAGGYNRLVSCINGRDVENEDLVNFSNWLPFTFRIRESEGMQAAGPASSELGNTAQGWLKLDAVEILDYRQVLDLREGMLHRTVRFRDAQGRETELAECRLVHMHMCHLAAQELTIRPIGWSGTLEMQVTLDGSVVNNNRAERGLANKHLVTLAAEHPDARTLLLKVETTQSHIQVGMALRTALFCNGVEVDAASSDARSGAETVTRVFALDVRPDDVVTVEKILAVYTSRDNAVSECALEARKAVARAPGFEALAESQRMAWKHLWHHFDMQIETEAGEAKALPSLILHLNAFHVLQTISTNSIDLDVSIPARGWHGEGYRGHIFWDNLYVFPFFNSRMPVITESLLKYRYRRLDEARALAHKAGFAGAMYPWQSGSDGEEETPEYVYNPIVGQWLRDYTHLQRHVNAAVSYNIWQYYEATGDLEFLYAYGAEMLIEIARFWASIAQYHAESGRYEIHGVIGPDEYHQRYIGAREPGLRNNAYTNLMAVWCLCRALESLERLPCQYRDELVDRLSLQPDELDTWNRISRRMRVDFFGNGIISQFEGYDQIPEFPWDDYKKQYDDFLHLDKFLLARGKTLDDYKVAKQADVLMLFYLFSSEELTGLFERLGYRLAPESIPLNIDYYARRTVHGSSLSRIANAWVLARSDRSRSWRLLQESLHGDVFNTQGGTTAEGIHLGAMGGSLDLMQRCYTGLELRDNILRFNPRLPSALKRLSLGMHYRGNQLEINITARQLQIRATECDATPIRVAYKNQVVELQPGETKIFSL